MAEKEQKSLIMGLLPIFTFAIILASLISTFIPELSSFLIFDRNAIMRGEIWRILTCHFVHFSIIHLAYNLVAFGVTGYVMGKKNYPSFWLLCLWLALAISISLFSLKPDMVYYGGLSGIVYGAMYYCALKGLKENGPWQKICFLALFLLPIKIGIEIYTSLSVFPYWEYQSFATMHTSHIVGCLIAVLYYSFTDKRKIALPIATRWTGEHWRSDERCHTGCCRKM